MKRIFSVLLFSFVGVLAVSGQNLIKPKQIKPDTLNRIIIMTDTITEVDTIFREFQYYSIDTLVKQIVNDSLGANLWIKDGTYSLRQRATPNNNFLFGTSVGEGLTSGSNNSIFGSNFNSITTGGGNFSYGNNNAPVIINPTGSFIGGANNLASVNQLTYSFVTGNTNATDATVVNYSFINGNTNVINSPNISWSFVNGINNGYLTVGNIDYSFLSGSENGYNSATKIQGSFLSGYRNAYSTPSITYSTLIGYRNMNSSTGQALYTAIFGLDNVYNSTNVQNSLVVGYRNNAFGVGTVNWSTLIGQENARSAPGVENVSALGLYNFYGTTSALTNAIAIGRENGYNNVSHSNSIYLGYRQGYTTGAANKLMIGMAQDDYLLGGDFSADWIRVNGYLEVRDKTGTAGNLTGWDGDKLVDSGIAASSVLTSEVDGSTTNEGLMTLTTTIANQTYTYSSNTTGSDPLILTEGTNIGLSRVGNAITIDNTFTEVDGSTTNELQTLSYTDATGALTLSASGTVTLPWEETGGFIQPSNTLDHIKITDGLGDKDGDLGTSGQVLSSTGTQVNWIDPPSSSLWDTDGLNVYRSVGRVGVGGVEHPTYTFTANSGTIHTNGAIRGDDFYMTGGLFDATTSDGNSGDILTSTGTAVDWVTPAISLDPGIAAMLSTTVNSTTSTSLIKMGFTSTEFNDGLTTSTVNERITVPSTGYYKVTFNGYASATSDTYMDVAIYVNGVQYSSPYYFLRQTIGNGQYETIGFSRTLILSASDYVEIWYASGGGTVSMTSPYFEVQYIKT